MEIACCNKHEDLTSDPQNPHKKSSYCGRHLQSWLMGSRDRRIPGVPCAAILAKYVSSIFSERPCLKKLR